MQLNQIIILSLIGILATNISNVWSFINERIFSFFIKSVKVEESSDFMHILQLYINYRQFGRVKNFYFRNYYDGQSNENQSLFYNVGFMFIRHNGRVIVINRSNYELKNATFAWKTSKSEFTIYSLHRETLISFVEMVKNEFSNMERHVYFNDNGQVKRFSLLSNKNFDNIFLNGQSKAIIMEHIYKFMSSKHEYDSLGLKYKTVLLFYGPAGSGKSSLATAIANHTKRAILAINNGKDMTDERLISLIANRPEKSMIVFEDLDCLFDNELNRNDKTGNNEVQSISLSCILNILDGSYTPNDCIIVITTNDLSKLDEAIKRAGRCNLLMQIDSADNETVARYIEYLKTIKPHFEPKSITSIPDIERQFLEA